MHMQQGITENFTYDNLNRLATSQVSGLTQQVFTYDAAGSIITKTGVGAGAWVYPTQGATAVQPHAVQSIPGVAGTFIYDLDGNTRTTPFGRTQTWTSFDMPLVFSQGSASSQFVYGPDHQRARQVRSDGTTIWYAGNIEVEQTASQTKVKTYWPRGVGLEIDVGTTNQPLWTHTDRLGSTVALSDASANLQVENAFDAWGVRRNLNGTQPTTAIVETLDNKGFTGQEELDQLGLVHLNGRVYDPSLGKFLSGDPQVSDPNNGQNYNRYAYVLNNPTTLSDPTGFEATCVPSKEGQPCPTSFDRLHKAQGWATVYQSTSESVSYGNGSTTDQTGKIKGNARNPESGTQTSVTSATNNGTVVRNLTAHDIIQSELVGAGNAIANGAVGFANLMIAMSPGDAELFGPVKPFTPVSEYFAQRGGATADGLMAVSGARALGGGLSGLAEDGALVIQKGGPHGDVAGIAGNESHHMPADSVSPLSKNNGPAISMETADHRQTASWGNSREARAYRAQQDALIKQGDFAGAQRMDIHDVQSKFGAKYNEAIRQMVEYTKGLFP